MAVLQQRPGRLLKLHVMLCSLQQDLANGRLKSHSRFFWVAKQCEMRWWVEVYLVLRWYQV